MGSSKTCSKRFRSGINGSILYFSYYIYNSRSRWCLWSRRESSGPTDFYLSPSHTGILTVARTVWYTVLRAKALQLSKDTPTSIWSIAIIARLHKNMLIVINNNNNFKEMRSLFHQDELTIRCRISASIKWNIYYSLLLFTGCDLSKTLQ